MASFFRLLSSVFFLQLRCQQISSLSPTRDKYGRVRSPGYGPEPNLDMNPVWATIQLMLGQEYGRANLLLLYTQNWTSACFRVNIRVYYRVGCGVQLFSLWLSVLGCEIQLFIFFCIFILGYSYFSKRICITLDYFRFRFS